MIPKKYHLTTKDGSLNKNEKVIVEKNIKLLGSGWNVRIYSDKDNDEILKQYYPEFIQRFNTIKKGVVKADIMRCLYMHQFGGIYSDTDYQFLRPLPDSILNNQCIIPAECVRPENYKLCNCLFMSEAGNAFWYDFVDEVLNTISIDNIAEKDIIPTSGPVGITKFYLANKNKYRKITIPDPIMFFPLKHRWELLKKANPNTYGVHYCLASWRNVPIFKRILMTFIQNMQVKGWNFRKISE